MCAVSGRDPIKLDRPESDLPWIVHAWASYAVKPPMTSL